MTRAEPEPSPARASSPKTWLAIARRVAVGTFDHRLSGLAAEVAFFALFALPPTLLALGGAIGFVGDAVGPDVTARARSAVGEPVFDARGPEGVRRAHVRQAAP